MIIIDTPFHVTFSSYEDLPRWACLTKCKKVWWDRDFEDQPIMGVCPMCQGGVTAAVETVHFKIVQKESRNLTLSDLTRFEENSLELKTIELGSALKKGAIAAHFSKVKNKFIERAINQWNAHNMEISVKYESRTE